MKKILKFLGGFILVVIILSAVAGGSDGEKKDIDSADTVSAEKVTITEQQLLNEKGVVITAKEYVEDSIWGDGIKLSIENNSKKDLTIGCNALIVNNYMINDLFSASIAAGKKSNETMYLHSSQLREAGIENVGQIEVYFHIFESEKLTDFFDSKCITIKTSAFGKMDTTVDDAGKELYNKNGIKIVGKTVDEDSIWGTAILLYCENKSDKNIVVGVDNVSVNGYMMTPLFSTTVYKGKMALDDITLFESELEENGITSVDEVELKFKIYNATSFKTIDESDTIKFSTK